MRSTLCPSAVSRRETQIAAWSNSAKEAGWVLSVGKLAGNKLDVTEIAAFRTFRIMARERPPDHLPAEVLGRPDFAEACLNRDLGAILRIAYKWGGPDFTLSHLARRCEFTVSRVREYMNGKRHAKSVSLFERIADSLHIPGKMLGIGSRPWEKAVSSSTTIVIPHSDLDNSVDDILVMIQEADRSDIGPGTIDVLQSAFDKLCRDYPSADATELKLGVQRLYSRVMQLREGRITLDQHKDLIALSGWLTALHSCIDWDMNRREAAETARAATLRFGTEIGHGELIAWSRELETWFALTEGRYRDAANMAAMATSMGSETSATVQLIMQEARAWARLKNRSAAENAIERGYSLLQKLPIATYPRHFVYDKTKFPFYVASCYQWLGDDVKAEKYAKQVFEECEENGTTLRSPMRMADVHLTLGLIYTKRGELEQAVDSGDQALTYDRKSGPSLLLRAAELDRAIRRRFPSESVGVEFHEKVESCRQELETAEDS
jgi:tetratricopeptide (TPR) repeat protein